MDKLANYCLTIKEILQRHATLTPSLGDIQTVAIFDDQTNNFIVLDLGWDRTGRVHAVVLHVQIKNNKIWIEVDNTENGITNEFLAKGIAKDEIVLGFYRSERRKLTDFAAA